MPKRCSAACSRVLALTRVDLSGAVEHATSDAIADDQTEEQLGVVPLRVVQGPHEQTELRWCHFFGFAAVSSNITMITTP